jgi:hypothetical protein
MRGTSRLNRIRKTMKEKGIGQGELKIIFKEARETEAEALTKAGVEPDDDSLTVFIVKWATKPLPGDMLFDQDTITPEPKQKTVADIDKKINELKADLLKDGFSALQIAEIEADSKKGSPDLGREKAHEADSQPLEVKPMKSDLGRMFR